MSEEISGVADAGAIVATVLDQLDRQVLGQRQAAEVLLAAYMAGGHVLVEGVPGIGKTLLARSFAGCLGVRFQRLQFTPDLMPSDVTGVNVFEPGNGRFRFTHGPIFTQVLMADEINRTPPKTQAALLEAMQERQVTVDGTSHPLDGSFFVVATQNPIEFEGTYPLPEAQLDRFVVRLEMGYPSDEAEVELLSRAAAGELVGWSSDELAPPCVSAEQAVALRHIGRAVHVQPEVVRYLQRLAAAARANPHVELGVSPRGVLALLEVGRAGAILGGRDFLTPDDLKRFLVPCWGHRLLLTPESELEGQSARRVLETVAEAVEVPH